MSKSAVILAMIFIPLLSCDKKDEVREGPVEIKLSQEQIELIDGSNRFGFNLFREVLSEEDEAENVFISPLSVHLALSMTWNGAAGSTRDQMMEMLHYPGYDDKTINASIQKLIKDLLSVDKKVETGIANSIWYRDTWTIEQDFLDVNKEYFDAQVRPLDFNNPESRNNINAWVAEMTNDRIDEIVDQIDPDHLMFLINAIYFKGVWTKEFVPENTREASILSLSR
jgi:serine protease inhibitor